MATSRTAKKYILGKEIAYMMRSAGKVQADVARILGTSQSKIAGVLDGKNAMSLGDLERLANHLGFTDPDYHATLFDLRHENHKRGFWSTGYRRAYSEELRMRVDVESHADRIREFEVEVIPGLLQHRSYVDALYEGIPEVNGLSRDEQIQARVARQDIFEGADPPMVHFVLSESCLRRMWCSPAVMDVQIDYLIQFSQREHVMLQIMPFSVPVGRRVSFNNTFTLLRMPWSGMAGPLEMAYVENEGEFRFHDDEKALNNYDSAWARLTSAALSFEDSRTFLRQVAKEFRDQ